MGIIKRPKLPPARPASSAKFSDGWRVYSPVVYRYMDDAFVNAFFEDGSLRLTTFSQCKAHKDEQRQDGDEGLMRLMVSHPESRAIHAIYELSSGSAAFVLCATLWHNERLMRDFCSNSFIRIHDPAEFGRRVAAHVPGFVAGGEGPCMYHHQRLVEATLEMAATESPATGEMNLAKWATEAVGHYPLFLKHKAYSHQAEYRLIWMTGAPLEVAYLDLKVPEARELCSRPGVFELEEDKSSFYFQSSTSR